MLGRSANIDPYRTFQHPSVVQQVQGACHPQASRHPVSHERRALKQAFSCHSPPISQMTVAGPTAYKPSPVFPSSGPAASSAPFRVYVAVVPLEGWEVVERLLGPHYPDALALHTLVVLQVAPSLLGTDASPLLVRSMPLMARSSASVSPICSSECSSGRSRRSYE